MYFFAVVEAERQENLDIVPDSDSVEMGSKIDHYFTIRVSPLYVSTINNLVRQVKANAVILNLYYSFFNYLKSENLGEIFEEVANNSFGLLVIFIQVYFRVCFNKLKCTQS